MNFSDTSRRLADRRTRLLRVATRLCGSRDSAEDLVHDALERLLRAGRIDADFGYQVRALRNTHIDRLRAAGRRVVTTGMPEGYEPPDERPSAIGDAREVLGAVAALPPGYRDAVVAVHVRGATYDEAARALELPLGTVQSRAHRGRARVVAALAV